MFKPGQRIELHPATDRWMRGDRFGEIIGKRENIYRVKMDRSGQTIRVSEANISKTV